MNCYPYHWYADLLSFVSQTCLDLFIVLWDKTRNNQGVGWLHVGDVKDKDSYQKNRCWIIPPRSSLAIGQTLLSQWLRNEGPEVSARPPKMSFRLLEYSMIDGGTADLSASSIQNTEELWFDNASGKDGPDGIWTHDLLVKSRSLCRSKLRAQRWLSLQRHKYFRLWLTDSNHFQSIA